MLKGYLTKIVYERQRKRPQDGVSLYKSYPPHPWETFPVTSPVRHKKGTCCRDNTSITCMCLSCCMYIYVHKKIECSRDMFAATTFYCFTLITGSFTCASTFNKDVKDRKRKNGNQQPDLNPSHRHLYNGLLFLKWLSARILFTK